MNRLLLILVGFSIACSLCAQEKLKPGPPFSNSMIFQQNQAICIWGKGIPGKQVICSLSTSTKSTTVESDGNWKIFLPARPASAEPLSLQLMMGDEKIIFTDILIGDVWLCIGQSNMEWPMSRELHWESEKYLTNQRNLRFLNPSPAGRNVYNVKFNDSILNRLQEEKFYLWNGWQVSNNGSASSMSAVAYYFAKRIQQDVDIPIGLINLSIGGAPLESFIGTDALKAKTEFSAKVQGNWMRNNSLPVWIRQRGLQNLDSVQYIYGDENGPNHAFKPGFAYKSGIDILSDFPIRGVLVYQGESNAEEKERVEEYGNLFKVMVDQYRENWSQPSLPFYWAQLSSIDRTFWPQFRNEQRKLMDFIPHSGMAVTSDYGLRLDVHPPNKKVVGDRLALWALNDVYGVNVTPSGPLPIHAKYKRGKVIVQFTYADGLQTRDGKALRELSIDGQHETVGRLHKNKLIIPATNKPSGVWYAWKPFSEGNLINKAGLPASTFYLTID